MANHNINDPENRTNKRLVQDDNERQKAAYSNGAIAGIVLVLVVLAVIAYVYYENNRVVVTTPAAPNTVQQMPATEAPASAPVSGPANNTNRVNPPANNP